ncbi:tyrosine phosphatase [Haloferula helveola]|uniref:Tyrosine phosphatase n=1 Tax=Haloferula helveola TaxID=490095 RepID=A0ABM7RDF2_9BACT|nr:tyrosine phosphatase [Haloferula helveola]
MNPIAPDDPRIRRAVSTVLAVARAAGEEPHLPATWERLERAEARGYFLPEEDDAIRIWYQAFLGGRAALLGALRAMEETCGREESLWPSRIPAFLAALGAACLLNRRSAELIGLASHSRLLRKKLDEPDARRGIPRKTFARLYRSDTSLRALVRFRETLGFYRSHRAEFGELREAEGFGELLDLLDRQAAFFADQEPLKFVRERLKYRYFSFRRRHHSGWKSAVFGVFEGSGRLISELRQPGFRPPPAEKRVTDELRREVLELVRPGDVFITRHDDAMTNLFLPGFWPHAALYIGSEEERRGLGVEIPAAHAKQAADPARFLESKKDGVRFRTAEETLAVDCFLVLRPPLEASDLAGALARAAGHAGKLYDFVFDFRRSDRLACTEVVYRAFDGCGPLVFSLLETGGRLCLPAEELIRQCRKQNFELVAVCGVGGSGILTGADAKRALDASREAI